MTSRSQPATILIVEDEAVVALDLAAQVREMGYSVVGVADTGERALALARTHQPDLTLMDIRLRGPMDGVQVAQQLMQEQVSPVLYMTSYSDPDTVQRAARTGPYGYLTKPFQSKELHAGIEVAIYKSRMERRLRESERWFASTLRCVQDGVLVTGADARVRFMNLAAEQLTGWPAEQALGHPAADLLQFAGPPDGRTSAERALHDGRVVGVQHARRLHRRDGREVPVDESAAPVEDEHGERLGAVVVLRDATERLQHEHRLRASEERFRSAFDHAPLGMALVSLDGHFMQVNAALCRLLGGDASRFKGESCEELTHCDDRAHQAARLRELLGSQLSVVQFEARYFRRDDGEPVHALVSVSLLRESDDPVCYLYQVNDLSAQKKAAEQLAELAAERMKAQAAELATQAKNEFLSRMSHELRTLLNAVLGFAQLMKMKGMAESPSAAAYTDHIIQAGQHLVALVDDVLDLQRLSTGRLHLNMTTLSLVTAVADASEFLAPLQQQYGVAVDCAVQPGVQVSADELRLRQVLLNVGSNAIKYNKPGGSVRCHADITPAGRVRLFVDDTGMGIATDALARMFQPFERLGKERSGIPGTGLGLVIARSLMQEMGGSLTVTSQLGAGTSVCLEFAPATAAAAGQAAASPQSPG
jgi:PAS domain S-box-containing protein